MRIINEPKYDFSDCLILPKRSSINSRKNVDLQRTFVFKHSKKTYTGFPLLAANMDHTGTFQMAVEMATMGASVALHKHYGADELIKFFNMPLAVPTFYSMGIGKADYDKFKKVHKAVRDGIQYVCIDVANGYTEAFVEFISKVRDYAPDVTIMAGNVVTAEMTEQLIISGADIVKVGIGGGCLSAESRILMSNGSYKNIVDVERGDYVITMTGEPAKVLNSFCTGFKSVTSIWNSHFHTPLTLTPDHTCFVGDLDTGDTLSPTVFDDVSKNPENLDKSEQKWMPAKDISHAVGLIPNNIKWDLPESFSYKLSAGENTEVTINSSHELGYMFGCYIGDGLPHTLYYGRDDEQCSVIWYINKLNVDTIDKLCSSVTFVTGQEPIIKTTGSTTMVTLPGAEWYNLFVLFERLRDKHLPSKYFCLDVGYLKGLQSGLIDSDVHSGAGTFVNQSPAIVELFGWVNYQLHGSYPLMKTRRGHGCGSYYQNVNNDIMMDGFQITKQYPTGGTERFDIPVYDLEIDHSTHSFIANNMIVHNSVCTTRKITGVGYPQLSAVIETADAAHGLGGLICSDGGHVLPGDVSKAFGAGADFVMLGGMLAGHLECNGLVTFGDNELLIPTTLNQYAIDMGVYYDLENLCFVINNAGTWERSDDYFDVSGHPSGMSFYGMSSKSAMNIHANGVAEYRASEGKQVVVPYRGSVVNTLRTIMGGVRSTCTYTGSVSLKELSKRTTFVIVHQTHNTVFGDE